MALTQAQAVRRLEFIGLWLWQVPAAPAALLLSMAILGLTVGEYKGVLPPHVATLMLAPVSALAAVAWMIGRGLRRHKNWARRVVIAISTGSLLFSIAVFIESIMVGVGWPLVMYLGVGGLNVYILNLLRPSAAGWVCLPETTNSPAQGVM